jgi:hypothetical protein
MVRPQRELREFGEAVKSHRTAASLLPNRARHWYNLGVSLYSSRTALPEAVEAFEVSAIPLQAVALPDRCPALAESAATE